MLDGNMVALRECERKQDRADQLLDSFCKEAKEFMDIIEDAKDSIQYLVDHYEHEHGLSFAEDAEEWIKEVIGRIR